MPLFGEDDATRLDVHPNVSAMARPVGDPRSSIESDKPTITNDRSPKPRRVSRASMLRIGRLKKLTFNFDGTAPFRPSEEPSLP